MDDRVCVRHPPVQRCETMKDMHVKSFFEPGWKEAALTRVRRSHARHRSRFPYTRTHSCVHLEHTSPHRIERAVLRGLAADVGLVRLSSSAVVVCFSVCSAPPAVLVVVFVTLTCAHTHVKACMRSCLHLCAVCVRLRALRACGQTIAEAPRYNPSPGQMGAWRCGAPSVRRAAPAVRRFSVCAC
jgi:hypothetical protein